MNTWKYNIMFGIKQSDIDKTFHETHTKWRDMSFPEKMAILYDIQQNGSKVNWFLLRLHLTKELEKRGYEVWGHNQDEEDEGEDEDEDFFADFNIIRFRRQLLSVNWLNIDVADSCVTKVVSKVVSACKMFDEISKDGWTWFESKGQFTFHKNNLEVAIAEDDIDHETPAYLRKRLRELLSM
jgi:hypothetical protein